uniref:pro-opiomelanocortin-like isoform X1 n=1 Tax=Scatophagus argus TaxID=75038 RepID=UPI001ED8396A|nr:pro-opiomelanocortin-like isoform X1 [Scatophagus argus]XP_046237840.1 pro-opiomelanocortin-like isoform X1 [Scatophagus argus]XP_046237845.1 pro-opiomelanocortin-like isoform X1 [Scatophagus argus]
MCPVWLLVAVAAVGVARGVAARCWEHRSCQEFSSESSVMVKQHTDRHTHRRAHFSVLTPPPLLQECIRLCRSDLTAETPVAPGNAHLQPLPPPDPSSSSPQAKRSYSMEHFRWGKPVGRKRRPVKVYTSNGVEEESAEVFPGEMRRRELASELLAAAEEEEEKVQESAGEVEEEQQQLLGDVQKKKDDSYKMKHFRWGGTPASKRYGGFMKSWDERSQKPLLTLFKNIINKDGQQQK